MKKLSLFILLLIATHVSAQSKFVIDGKTTVVANGKAIIARSGPDEFFPFTKAADTVPIRNHSFTFTGMLKYPERLRVFVLAKGKPGIPTEPFFVSAGRNQMTIDENADPHEILDFGMKADLQNSPANDEYIQKFLPGYNQISKRYDDRDRAITKCNLLKDKKAKAGCLVTAQAIKEDIRKSHNAFLQAYTNKNPRSAILPWLLYDYIHLRGYYDAYAGVLKQIAAYHPENMNNATRDFLARQKQITPGYPFVLKDLVEAQLPKNRPAKRYILVDFWFSQCGPCLAQFNKLKRTYSQFGKKDLEIITVSVDDRQNLATYKKVLAKNKYPWLQALDLGGAKSRPMGISSYPTGFLLDNHWKIVKAHIDADRLDGFLEGNLL